MYKKNYTFIWLCIKIVIHLNCQTKYNKMKNQEAKNTNKFVNQLSVIIPRNNGTQAGINALAESLKRGLAK